MAKFCAFCGMTTEPTERHCKNCGAQNPDFVDSASGAAGAAGPASSGRLDFEPAVVAFGDRLVKSLGLGHPGAPMGVAEMMIRGAFLDGAVYRQAAADTGGNANALIAVLIPVAASFLGGFLTGFHLFFGIHAILFIAVSALISLCAMVASLGLMSVCSLAVVGRKLDFGQVFRGLAYAMSPGVLLIIPILGFILALFRILTCLVAVREISGSDLIKSLMLLLVGVVGAIIIGAILSPLTFSLLALRPF